MTRFRSLALALMCVVLVCIGGCGDGREPLRVFAADSLTASFRELELEYEKLHPTVDVVLDIHGSILLTRLVPIRRADVVAVADHRLVEKILAPKHAEWVAKFAGTEIVLAGTSASKYRDKINTDNWHEILLRPDVRYGVADPSQDPCGYYTRLAWALAESHYKLPHLARKLDQGCPAKNRAPDALRLISEQLAANRVDYAFVYRVHAKDLKLPYTPLPREINLGHREFAARYAAAQVLVPNFRGGTETMTGTAIAFGVTIPAEALNVPEAQRFIQFLLSERGRAILGRSEFRAIQPALVPSWCPVPEFLGDLAVAEDRAPSVPGP